MQQKLMPHSLPRVTATHILHQENEPHILPHRHRPSRHGQLWGCMHHTTREPGTTVTFSRKGAIWTERCQGIALRTASQTQPKLGWTPSALPSLFNRQLAGVGAGPPTTTAVVSPAATPEHHPQHGAEQNHLTTHLFNLYSVHNTAISPAKNRHTIEII